MRWPSWLRSRPWIWLIVLYLFVAVVYAGFVILARQNPPLPADGIEPTP